MDEGGTRVGVEGVLQQGFVTAKLDNVNPATEERIGELMLNTELIRACLRAGWASRTC